jgi:hypothetical protein
LLRCFLSIACVVSARDRSRCSADSYPEALVASELIDQLLDERTAYLVQRNTAAYEITKGDYSKPDRPARLLSSGFGLARGSPPTTTTKEQGKQQTNEHPTPAWCHPR